MIRLAALLAVLALPLEAQTICAPQAEMVQRLKVEYSSSLRGRGRQGPGQSVEFWASDDTGVWTMLVIYSRSTACIVAMGEAWSDLAPPESPPT